jgi:hypothetical protein
MSENLLLGDWKPIIKNQAHKRVKLHFIPLVVQHPLCDYSKSPQDLTANRITSHCNECDQIHQRLLKGILRKCKVCGYEAHTEKDLEKFRPDTTMLFGYSNICSKCFSQYIHNYDIKNRKIIRERGKVKRLKNPDYAKNWKIDNKTKAAQRLAQRKNPKLEKCILCLSIDNLVRHHPDYTKPKDIIVLCKSCHSKIHSKRNSVKLVVNTDGTAHLVDTLGVTV